MYRPILVTLYFDRDANLFVDENGEYIFNIFEWITPNELYLFRICKEIMTFYRVPEDIVVELVWPDFYERI